MDCINTEATDVNLRMCPVIRYSDIHSHSHNSSFTSWAKVDRETLLQHQMAGSPSQFVLCPGNLSATAGYSWRWNINPKKHWRDAFHKYELWRQRKEKHFYVTRRKLLKDSIAQKLNRYQIQATLGLWTSLIKQTNNTKLDSSHLLTLSSIQNALTDPKYICIDLSYL